MDAMKRTDHSEHTHHKMERRLDLIPEEKSNSFVYKQETTESSLPPTTPPHTNGFVGTYGHIRKRLDYTYHTHYVKQRQWLHDAIIQDSLIKQESGVTALDPHNNLPLQKPVLILAVGVHGAGKHRVIRELVLSGKLQLQSLVDIDPDDIRRYLPEDNVSDEPLTRREAGYVAETLLYATLEQGRNAIYHCNLRDYVWYRDVLCVTLRQRFPNLCIALFHIHAQVDLVLTWAEKRCRDTGRKIPRDEILRDLLENIPHAVEETKDAVDVFCEIENTTDELLLKHCNVDFETAFDQTANMGNGTCAAGINDSNMRHKCCLQTLQNQLSLRTSLFQRKFSTLKSTEENHQSNDRNFYGPYAHIRETLDYSFHKNYTRERQHFQDSVIREFIDSAIVTSPSGEVGTTPKSPWIVFTAGSMGAGKGYTIRKLVENGCFPLTAFVRVDPDAIRRYLPEFSLYLKQAPERAGDLTNKEAGYVAEILTLAGLEAGKNVMVDGSLRQSEWYKRYFARLRDDFPNLRLAILHVTAQPETIFARAEKRAKQTGRVVPRKLLEQTIHDVPESVKKLAPLVDYHAAISNNDTIEILNGTWEEFQEKWVQDVAWVASNQKFLERKRSSLENLVVNGTEQ